jgi:multisubunit Na+/H+ antiporter MnhC subunit
MTSPVETAVVVGVLFAAGLYLLLDRNYLRSLIGFITLANAANVLILAMSGDPTERSAPVLDGKPLPPADPLPQALILTAIVIGFGVTAYLAYLYYRLHVDTGGADLSQSTGGDEDVPGAEEVR